MAFDQFLRQQSEVPPGEPVAALLVVGHHRRPGDRSEPIGLEESSLRHRARVFTGPAPRKRQAVFDRPVFHPVGVDIIDSSCRHRVGPTKEWIMTTYLFSYRMPADYTPGRPGIHEAWQSFFEGIGSSLVDPGNPTFESTELGTCESATTRLGGFSLVTADDFEAAVAIAKACPALAEGGGVEVGAVTEIYPSNRLIAQD
jgi:hypothetical protein